MYEDILTNDSIKIETISRIIQQRFKLLQEAYDRNQVNSSKKACSASTPIIDSYGTNLQTVNVDINIVDDLD